MKIAQVAPLHESVPPKLYGGTERVVSYLTEELVRMGHQVTLYASGDSETKAKLVPVCPRALRLDQVQHDPVPFHVRLVDQVARDSHKYDLIHFHLDFLHFPVSRYLHTPHVTTLHGRQDLPDLPPFYAYFNDQPVVSISNDQRRPLPGASFVATVYNGIPEDLYTLQPNPGSYLAFLGRTSPEKGIETAIDIALAAGVKLKIAAKVDKVDEEYFRERIAPRLHHPLIEFVGEINDREKNDFLGGAMALLFPIDWPEPFGLVMIEAMACGTPVIAFRRGSVPEVVRDGVSGFIVDTPEEGVQAVKKIGQINRLHCRNHFADNFTARKMAEGYVEVYERLIQAGQRLAA